MAWHGMARRGEARHGMAWLGKAWRGEATHTAHSTECAAAWSGQKVCPRGHTKQEISWRGADRQGRARLGRAWRGLAGLGAAGHGWARHGEANSPGRVVAPAAFG